MTEDRVREIIREEAQRRDEIASQEAQRKNELARQEVEELQKLLLEPVFRIISGSNLDFTLDLPPRQ